MKNRSILTFAVISITALSLQLTMARPQDQDTAQTDLQESPQAEEAKQVPENNPDALNVLRNARSMLFQRESVQANLVHRARLGNYHFSASGQYSAAKGFRTRIEYSVELGEMTGEFLEVCDGQILHTRRVIGVKAVRGGTLTAPQVELARRDIQKILKETQKYLDVETSQASEVMRAAEIGIGGLPAILASLERCFIFDALKQDQENGQDTVIIQGLWNPVQTAKFHQELGGFFSQVGQFLPDRVRVTFLKDSSFPIRFQYLKQIDSEKKIFRPMLTVELSDVQLDRPVVDSKFTYLAPPGIEERDETDLFIETIRQSSEVSESPQNPEESPESGS